MKIYSVSDGYVDYLHNAHSHVYLNKENARSHDRKYVGAVIELYSFNYYIRKRYNVGGIDGHQSH